jgi:thermostable 8-oxoguanine DNA glycosylase
MIYNSWRHAMKDFDFENKEQILSLIARANDSQETIDLISYFETIKNNRVPLYLDEIDFEKILKWKLRKQYYRQEKQRLLNTNDLIKKITKTAFEIEHLNKDYEIELKLKLLTSLKGVGIPIASAILTLIFPNKYAVIDFRIWRQLNKKPKISYTIGDYLRYLKHVKQLSEKYNLSTQQIDMAIWQLDIEKNKKNERRLYK